MVGRGSTGGNKRLVAYIRVSTSHQGRSGLGIEAQRDVLVRFAQAQDDRLEKL